MVMFMYGSSVCTYDKVVNLVTSLKLVDYRLVHTDEPYINLHLKALYKNLYFFQKFLTLLILGFVLIHTLNRSYKWSPYIFNASSESKNRSYKNLIIALSRLCKLFHLKMTC